MVNPQAISQSGSPSAGPQYDELVRFLVQPFLDASDALKVDCEISPSRPRIWVRLAIEGEDKGRVFGRGRRNIEAIRMVLEATAQAAGQSIHLDIYGAGNSRTDTPPPTREANPTPTREANPRIPRPQSRQSGLPRPSSQPRSPE